MTLTDVLQLLREGILEGRTVALTGASRGELEAALKALGADVRHLDERLTDDATEGLADIDALVVDAGVHFTADAGAGELTPLLTAMERAWAAARAVANAAWIGPERPGKLVLVAPQPQDGPHTEAARAALENLSRTLSIEWARFQIRTTTITPGPQTDLTTVAALVGYLISPAGDYFSGARLDLS